MAVAPGPDQGPAPVDATMPRVHGVCLVQDPLVAFGGVDLHLRASLRCVTIGPL